MTMHYTARDLKQLWMRGNIMLEGGGGREPVSEDEKEAFLERKIADISLSSVEKDCQELKRWLKRDIHISLKNILEYSIPKARLTDIAGYADVKERLKELVIWPLLRCDYYQKLGLSLPSGVLLYGPSGCGKTLLVHAIANECSVHFLSVKG
jgi:SpoVK/Ycf46/Vps4 family AAA+-type ATPase